MKEEKTGEKKNKSRGKNKRPMNDETACSVKARSRL